MGVFFSREVEGRDREQSRQKRALTWCNSPFLFFSFLSFSFSFFRFVCSVSIDTSSPDRVCELKPLSSSLGGGRMTTDEEAPAAAMKIQDDPCVMQAELALEEKSA